MSIGRAVAVTAAFIAAVGSSGCFFLKKDDDRQAYNEPTPVVVENNNWLETTVYAVRSGSRIRLGTVGTGQTGHFMLPAGFTTGGSIRLVADPIGSRATYSTEPLNVSPGSQLQLRVENNLRLSTVSMW